MSMSLVVVKFAGNAGGVRTAVAVGTGVAVGKGVSVGSREASAVWYACVEIASMSIVGVAAEGAHDANRMASRPRLRMRRFVIKSIDTVIASDHRERSNPQVSEEIASSPYGLLARTIPYLFFAFA